MSVTVRINESQRDWISNCMEVLDIDTFPLFFERLHEEVVRVNRQAFYERLPLHGSIKRQPLKGKRIRERGTTCG